MLLLLWLFETYEVTEVNYLSVVLENKPNTFFNFYSPFNIVMAWFRYFCCSISNRFCPLLDAMGTTSWSLHECSRTSGEAYSNTWSTYIGRVLTTEPSPLNLCFVPQMEMTLQEPRASPPTWSASVGIMQKLVFSSYLPALSAWCFPWWDGSSGGIIFVASTWVCSVTKARRS